MEVDYEFVLLLAQRSISHSLLRAKGDQGNEVTVQLTHAGDAPATDGSGRSLGTNGMLPRLRDRFPVPDTVHEERDSDDQHPGDQHRDIEAQSGEVFLRGIAPGCQDPRHQDEAR